MTLKPYDKNEIREYAAEIQDIARSWINNVKSQGASQTDKIQEADFF